MSTCINLQTRCFVSNIMPVKRFKKLLQAFHVNDNMKAAKRGIQTLTNFTKSDRY